MKRVIVLFIVAVLNLMAMPDLKNLLQKIPDEDLTSLERFFQLLIREEVLGYTLFGQKPISIADFPPPSYRFLYFSKELICEKGWNAWTRYRNQFPSPFFALKREVLADGSPHFYLINRSATLDMIRKNIELFQNFNQEMTPEEILDQLCDPNKEIHDLLSTRFLWGLFLGFGKENAFNFEREGEICKAICGKILPPFFSMSDFESLRGLGKQFVKRCPSNKSVFNNHSSASLIKEYNELYERRKCFHRYSFLDQFDFPQFICWGNSPETNHIREAYVKTKEKIQKRYQDSSFLEVTLKQWMAPQ